MASVDTLRIRLEGKLEVVEEAVDQLRHAHRALASSAWAEDAGWWPLINERDEPRSALDELTRVAPENELITAFERERAELRRLASQRLTELSLSQSDDETLAGALGRLRAFACPVISGTMRVLDKPGATEGVLSVLWVAVTGGLTALFWSLFDQSDEALLLKGLSLALVTGPILWVLLRSVVRPTLRFRVSAENLWLMELIRPIALNSLVGVRMVRANEHWQVTWSFTNRPEQVCTLSEVDAGALRGILQKQGVEVEP